MSEDLLEDMERDSGVGEPGGIGVSEPVSGEVGEAEVSNDLVPGRGVTNVTALGLLGDESAGTGERLSSNGHGPVVPVDVFYLEACDF